MTRKLLSSRLAKGTAIIGVAAIAFGLLSLYHKLSFMYGGGLDASLRQVEEHARVQLGCKMVSDTHAEFFNWRMLETTGEIGFYRREYTFTVAYSCDGVATRRRVEASEELGEVRILRVQEAG